MIPFGRTLSAATGFVFERFTYLPLHRGILPPAEATHDGSRGSRNVRQGKAKETSHTLGSEDDTNNIESRDSQIWKEAAFPQYLQESIESSNFCDLWEEAKTRHSTLQGQEKHVKDTTLWKSIRREAEKDANDEPLLSSFLYASILSHDSFERSLAFILANRLSNTTLLPTELFELFHNVLSRDNVIRDYAQADLCAMRERDPACRSYSQALLYFKGFHAIQVQRIAHSLWNEGRKVMALALQSRSSEVFAVDIHPAAKIGKGLLLDHGTGVVIGETARIGNNVSILQNVTLGGTGKQHGDRHPKVSDNVLIGASATILGNIVIGKGSQVAAGSLVLKPVQPRTMVAGSPAKEVGKVAGNPARDMMQWYVKKTGKKAMEGQQNRFSSTNSYSEASANARASGSPISRDISVDGHLNQADLEPSTDFNGDVDPNIGQQTYLQDETEYYI